MARYSQDRAKHRVHVLIPPDVVALDLVVPLSVFGPWSEQVYADTGVTSHPYEVALVGEPDAACGPYLGARDVLPLSQLARADTVIVPGTAEPLRPVAPELSDAVRAAHARGARIISICTGAFILGEAGVLGSGPVTTHWAWADHLEARHPEVEILRDQLYVDAGDVITSAGILAGVDLCLHVLRTDHGQAVANTVARYLVSAPHRQGGQAQFIQSPAPDESGALGDLLGWMLANLDQPLTLAAIARQAHTSTRTLSRRFKAITGSSVLDWVTAQRVVKARTLLETTDLPIAEVAVMCGFGSMESLRVHFNEHNRTTPSRYRQTFR
ncbi:GlxA family transcriptional regulator [Lentzea sp. NPDC059081]|uniref:GlxA family transcriptional regulator n=1 Tax=Lentzea sp. NPDC059081 TaxID=3346719 RepID=UPI0036AE14A0